MNMAYRLFLIIALMATLLSFRDVFAQQPPYPPSTVITNITWAPSSTIIRKAYGSDTWPITWADDDNLYTAYGDGRGFDPKVPDKLSLGFARIEGMPPDFTGINIRSSDEQYGDGRRGKKASGMLMVEGILYMWVRNADNNGQQSQLAWSTDHGQNWTWSSWKFENFGYCTFINFGKNYEEARDNFVYIVSHDHPSAYTAADIFVLLRCPREGLSNKANWEFFAGLDGNGNPLWSSNIVDRGAVFTFPGNCRRSGLSYNSDLGRYFWWQQNGGNVDTRFSGGFGVYDAPDPWGPWTAVYYTDSWDVGPGETGSFPPKWMSSDGKTMYLVFSGNDYFSVRKATLTVSLPEDTTPPTVPSNLTAFAVSESGINLQWEAANDLESGISRYNIFRDNTYIGHTMVTSFSDKGLAENSTYTYKVSAVNGAGLESEKSAPILATTLADTTPPTIISVTTSGDPNKVTVVFSEPVEEASSENMSNYGVDNGVTISGASLALDLKTVVLTTSPHTGGVTYTLNVNNIKDRASTPNVIAANTQVTYAFAGELVISNLTVYSGKAYEVVEDGLQIGSLAYIDRSYTFSEVPASLLGATYIKTANDDKGLTGSSFITFEVNQDVTVYVAHDNRIATKPSWMASFTDTGEDLVTTDTTLSIFAKDFSAGTVTLGGNEGGGNSMYSVIIVAQDTPQLAAPTGLRKE